MADLTGSGTLLVSMGTDHHHFDRLSGWVESWLDVHSEVRCVVQEGASRVPRRAVGVGVLPREEFRCLIRESDMYVCQGGPGSILDALAEGVVPIAVPRLAARHEVVDDHQVSFTRKATEIGWAHGVETEDALHQELDLALTAPEIFRRPPAESNAHNATQTLESMMATMEFRPLRARRLPRTARLALTTLRGIEVPAVGAVTASAAPATPVGPEGAS
jgi:UDP-N-acetylglucosamine transferase subunit ALG13